MFDKVKEISDDSKMIYGSRIIAATLKHEGFLIGDRTLRNYMNRWGRTSKVRKARNKSEAKNTNVEYKDHVKRNFNTKCDNIIALDVSYIPANVS